MTKSEYRRAFIMLRAATQGYGGHARLERRTLTGSLYFVVNAPQDAGALAVALAGQRDGAYYAAPIGRLTRDRRGQLTLAWSFDPRAIDGRPLEAYAWVAVVRADGDCALALTGNMEGSRPMDPAALRRAVCERLAPRADPAADLPEPGETEGEPPSDADFTAPPPEPTDAEPHGDVRVYTPARARRVQAAPPAEDAVGDAAQVEAVAEIGIGTVEAAAQAAPEPVPKAAPIPEAEPAEAAPAVPPPGAYPDAPEDTAARRLGLDITRPWPGAAEPLRRLFATQPPQDAPLEDGFTYVRAPMPDGSGCRECLIGVRAEDGVPVALRYALPGRYSPEPPAGMEDYRWTEPGYWVAEARP